jgi:hypothetical protein
LVDLELDLGSFGFFLCLAGSLIHFLPSFLLFALPLSCLTLGSQLLLCIPLQPHLLFQLLAEKYFHVVQESLEHLRVDIIGKLNQRGQFCRTLRSVKILIKTLTRVNMQKLDIIRIVSVIQSIQKRLENVTDYRTVVGFTSVLVHDVHVALLLVKVHFELFHVPLF